MMRQIGRPAVLVRAAATADCGTLADIHAATFRRGWSEAEFEALLLQNGVHCLIADYRSAFGRRSVAGFVLYRIAGDEAEILSIAVTEACRRRGVARRLMEEVLRHLYRERVAGLLLEVEDVNAAAIALYRGLDFAPVGQRPAYYQQGRTTPRGALVMRRQVR